mmetsp:Transcript_60522/g.142559  ORF Transcript_60522/g.142559 Transcript_60522/m.142559 type:complete len:304 (-) Transcript_60522:94-1005(-)
MIPRMSATAVACRMWSAKISTTTLRCSCRLPLSSISAYIWTTSSSLLMPWTCRWSSLSIASTPCCSCCSALYTSASTGTTSSGFTYGMFVISFCSSSFHSISKSRSECCTSSGCFSARNNSVTTTCVRLVRSCRLLGPAVVISVCQTSHAWRCSPTICCAHRIVDRIIGKNSSRCRRSSGMMNLSTFSTTICPGCASDRSLTRKLRLVCTLRNCGKKSFRTSSCPACVENSCSARCKTARPSRHMDSPSAVLTWRRMICSTTWRFISLFRSRAHSYMSRPVSLWKNEAASERAEIDLASGDIM